MKKTMIFLATVIVLLCGGTSSFGQTVSDEAKRHFDRGMAAVETAKSVEDYLPAIREFEEAARLAPDWPEVRYTLGLVQEEAERYGDAISNLRRYLELAPKASDAEAVKSLVNKLEFRKETAEKERLDPNNLIGLWVPGEENAGAFVRFEIRINNGTVEGGMRKYAFSEERGLARKPWFVPVQWDGTTLVIPHTRYFYCDKSVQADCCPADASLSLTMVAPDTLKGTLRIAPYRHHDGITSPEDIQKRLWKRFK